MSDNPYDTLVVELFGGPGVGKSTTAAHIFKELKWRQISSELVVEYAKGKVHEDSLKTLEHQIYVFAKQLHYVWRAARNVNVVVQDASLLNSLIYEKESTPQEFKDLVLHQHSMYNHYSIYIERDYPYDPTGRYQTEEEAKALDEEIWEMTQNLGIETRVMKSGPENIDPVINEILELI